MDSKNLPEHCGDLLLVPAYELLISKEPFAASFVLKPSPEIAGLRVRSHWGTRDCDVAPPNSTCLTPNIRLSGIHIIAGIRRNQLKTMRAVRTSDVISNSIASRLHDRLTPWTSKTNFFQMTTSNNTNIAQLAIRATYRLIGKINSQPTKSPQNPPDSQNHAYSIRRCRSVLLSISGKSWDESIATSPTTSNLGSLVSTSN